MSLKFLSSDYSLLSLVIYAFIKTVFKVFDVLLVNGFETNSAGIFLQLQQETLLIGAHFSELNMCLWFDQSKDICGSH